jgi:Tol biopolymer transport system component
MDEQRLERALRQGPPYATGYVPSSLALDAQPVVRGPNVGRLVLIIAAAALLALAVGTAVIVGMGIMKLPVLPTSSTPRLAYEIDGDIYLADWDGANAVRVADGGGEGKMWAPDGRHFAYRSAEEVHVRDAEGRLVASVPGSGWDVGWSPDSTRIATWVGLFETIGIYGIEGERQALLTAPSCGSGDHDPVWSPDGRSVVVESWSCEMPIDGSGFRFLSAPDPRAHYEWVYSPDGTRVAYVTKGGDCETFTSSIVIAEATGTELKVVHEESLPSPWYDNLVWSPSGDRLLFSRTPRSQCDFRSAASELRQVDISTGRVTTIAAVPGIRPIRLSPDGDRILFATWDDSQAARYTGLWSIDTDGSRMQLLVPNTGFGDWQPLLGQ